MANECRSTCGLSVARQAARGGRSSLRIFQKPTRLSGAAARVEEQPRRRCARPSSSAGRAVALIAAHPVGRLLADRHEPLLVALADARQVLLVEVQIGGADADQLGDAHAGRVEQLDHRAIAQAAAASRRRAARSARRLPRATGTSAAPATRAAAADRRRDCRRRRPIEDQKPVEAADGGDRARDRPRRQPARHLLRGRTPRAPARSSARARVPAPAANAASAAQIARVAFERVVGQPPFDAQMVEIGVDTRHG